MGEVKTIKSSELFRVSKELLKNGKNIRITVTGDSMYPFLRQSIDSVELSYKDFTHINRGDIVLTIRSNNEYVLHRVIKKEEYSFYIVGDAQQLIEGPLKPNQIIATVSTIWRDKNKIDCSNIYLRILSSLWLNILPLRHFIIKSYSIFRKLI